VSIHVDKFLVKGIRDELNSAINEVPQSWPTWCQNLPMTARNETFAWAGDLPTPRVMTDGRLLQHIDGYDYDVTTHTHELSVLIDREMLEDDQIGALMSRVNSLGRAWPTYKESLAIGQVLAADTNLAWDGTALIADTRVVGASANIDNLLGGAAATGTIPTSAEFLAAMAVIIAAMVRFQSDKGKPTPNLLAIQKLLILAPPTHTDPIRTALAATELAATTNIYGKGLAEAHFSPFITDDDTTYVIANGDAKKPILHLSKTPLETIVYSDPHWIDHNDGLLVTLRERFDFVPGDFYKIVEYIWT